MERTQKYINVYTYTFCNSDGQVQLREVKAYNISQARSIADAAYPNTRFLCFYPSGQVADEQRSQTRSFRKGGKK